MRFTQKIGALSIGVLLSGVGIAAVSDFKEQVQVPLCLASKITVPYTTLAQNKQFKIIELASKDLEHLVTLEHDKDCGHFVNVSHKIASSKAIAKENTAQTLLAKRTGLRAPTQSYEINHASEVHQALSKVVPDNIWQTVSHLTSYENRSATKENGVDVAKWLKSSFESMAIEYGRKDTATFFVNTGWYKQPSLVTVIGKDINAPAIVIGAHMDTLDGRMPGAGDDASGSASAMEAARVLLSSSESLKRPVYIIWYAAEERGLVGSQYVVEYFQEHSIPVKAAIQLDMTGYRNDPEDSTMWVYMDYTDSKLSQFIATLIQTYVNVPVDYSRCGYGCSDHASWTDIGVPAAFPCETNFEDHNPYIHTPSDKMNLLSLDHMTNFTKLALAFALELGLEE